MSLLVRLKAIQSVDIPAPRLPIIDAAAAADGTKDALPGLRFLRDEAKRDFELLRQRAGLSANGPYLVAVWDELVHARHPVAIYRMFSPDDTKSRAVKVDVVAEHGARWVRVNTTKNARLMMEFHEIDSYLTSDDEGDARPRLAQTEFDNSLLRMGRELLAAAKANPISNPTPSSDSTTVIPQVTMRLTRLNPLDGDIPAPRIEKTIQYLRDMGIDVQLGERPHLQPTLIPKAPMPMLEPTTNINLDLSTLIALVSDISHSPLPLSELEAHAWFEPPQSYLDWKKDRVKVLACQSQNTHRSLCHAEGGQGDEGTWENSGQHLRSLAAQAIQEMNKGILEEIRERVSTFHASVTFWVTSEARHRCLQIVSKIGGEREKLRTDALLGSTLCPCTPLVNPWAHTCTRGVVRTDDDDRESSVDAYWEHSRYPPGFLPLVPVRVYPSILPVANDENRPPKSSLFHALERTCTGILSHETVPAPQIPTPSSTPTAERTFEEIPPAVSTSLPKLTVHTVTSMLAGAARGYTTLTTNRRSVKAMLKAMRRAGGGCGCKPNPTEKEEKAAL